jgi:hypothetical protein
MTTPSRKMDLKAVSWLKQFFIHNMVPRKQYRLWYISSGDIFYPVSDTSREPDSCKQDKVVQATSISIGYIILYRFSSLPCSKRRVDYRIGRYKHSMLDWYAKSDASAAWQK